MQKSLTLLCTQTIYNTIKQPAQKYVALIVAKNSPLTMTQYHIVRTVHGGLGHLTTITSKAKYAYGSYILLTLEYINTR